MTAMRDPGLDRGSGKDIGGKVGEMRKRCVDYVNSIVSILKSCINNCSMVIEDINIRGNWGNGMWKHTVPIL